MRLPATAAFAAVVIGSALGSAHGCSAHADPGTGGGAACARLTCTYAPPAPAIITSYADLLSTLQSGARVRAVLDYSQCQLSGAPGPAAQGAMNMDTFEWFGAGLIGNPKAFVAASTTQLIRLSSGFVYDYARVRVSEDDTVAIDVQYLDPTSFAVTVDETIDCGISDATTTRGATFYKMSP